MRIGLCTDVSATWLPLTTLRSCSMQAHGVCVCVCVCDAGLLQIAAQTQSCSHGCRLTPVACTPTRQVALQCQRHIGLTAGSQEVALSYPQVGKESRACRCLCTINAQSSPWRL